MIIIYLATGWLKTFEIPTYDLNGVMNGNEEYIDTSSSRVSQFFVNTSLSRYPNPNKEVFDNISDFKES